MRIGTWIRNKAGSGSRAFTVAEVKEAFPTFSPHRVHSELNDLARSSAILPAYRGFYVIVPERYLSSAVVPPLYYVDPLMSHLGRPYYVSLRSAAELLGVSPRRSQALSVTTRLPQLRASILRSPMLTLTYRKEIRQEFLLETYTENGPVKYSSPELTALDLVQFSRYVGGLQGTIAALRQLCGILDMDRFTDELCRYVPLTTLQHLGYILERRLSEPQKADVIYGHIVSTGRKMLYRPLGKKADGHGSLRQDERWKVVING